MYDIVYQILKTLYQIYSISFRWKNNYWSHQLWFIKRSNKDLTSTWYFGTYHILANITGPFIAHADAVGLAILILVWVCIYIPILCGCRQQRLWWVCTFATLAWAPISSHCNEYLGTKSNVLAHFIYYLLQVIIYLAWFEISKGLIGCNFITTIMFPCAMLSTKFNIKQNYSVKLSLIDRNDSNKNPNELVKSFHLVMSIIQC